MWSLVRPVSGPAGFTLWCFFFGKKIRLQHKRNFPSIYWSICLLMLDWRFSWCYRRRENEVKAKRTWSLFCYFCLFCFVFFFYGALYYLDKFWSQAYAIKCVKKDNFWCTRRTRNVLSTCKNNSVDWLNFKTKVIDNIPK